MRFFKEAHRLKIDSYRLSFQTPLPRWFLEACIDERKNSNPIYIFSGNYDDFAEEQSVEHSEDETYQLAAQLVGMNWLKVMRCAAHTLQLGVLDFLSSKQLKQLLMHVRNVVKKLRTPTVRHLLKEKGAAVPVIDCITRWSSTHDMLESLINILETVRSYVQNKILDVKLPSSFWNSIVELHKVLKPAKTTTLVFQTERLTAGKSETSP